MNKNFVLVSSLMAMVSLSACGKMGPIRVDIQPQQAFEIEGTKGSKMSFVPGQNIVGVASYSGFSKKLTMEIQGQKLVFKGAKADLNNSEFISSPSDSGVRTTGGEFLGFSAKGSPVCNPECERVERDVRDEYCTYYIQMPIVVCNGRIGRGYDHGHGEDHHDCYTRWETVSRTGHRLVEHVTRTREYDLKGSIFGATLGEMASTHALYSAVTEETRVLSGCYARPYPY